MAFSKRARERCGGRAAGAEGEQGRVSAQLLEVAAARSAVTQVLLERKTLFTLERIHCVESEIVGELFVCAHAITALRKANSAVRMRVLIVPSGSPVFFAISVCVIPWK